MNATTAKNIRIKLNAILAEHLPEYAAACQGGGRYSDNDVTLKVVVAEREKDGSVVTKEMKAWETYAGMNLLPEDGLGKVIELRGERYKVTGFNPRARRMPVQLERVSDGAGRKCSADLVRDKLLAACGATPKPSAPVATIETIDPSQLAVWMTGHEIAAETDAFFHAHRFTDEHGWHITGIAGRVIYVRKGDEQKHCKLDCRFAVTDEKA